MISAYQLITAKDGFELKLSAYDIFYREVKEATPADIFAPLKFARLGSFTVTCMSLGRFLLRLHRTKGTDVYSNAERDRRLLRTGPDVTLNYASIIRLCSHSISIIDPREHLSKQHKSLQLITTSKCRFRRTYVQSKFHASEMRSNQLDETCKMF